MKTIVGLGNPGKKYQNNRHNVGQMLVDYLSGKVEAKLVKTDSFMNHSGIFVKKLNVKINDLYIAHDDLDIPLGKFHIQFGVGPQLHNGLESIEQRLKRKDFWRIRIGVDARTKDNWIDGETYILNDFNLNERKLLEEEVFPKILSQLKHP